MNNEITITTLVQQAVNAGHFTLELAKNIGDAAAGIKAIKEMAKWAFLNSAKEDLETQEKITADFNKTGIALLEELSKSGYQKSEFVRTCYLKALKNALDPNFHSPELRKEDLETLDTLDPSDFIVITTVGKCTSLMLDEWSKSPEYTKIIPIIKPYGGVVRQVSNLYPQGLIYKYSKIVFPGIKLTEDDLLYTINERVHTQKEKQPGLYTFDRFSGSNAWVNTENPNESKTFNYNEMKEKSGLSDEIFSSLMKLHLTSRAKRISQLITRNCG